jgi:molecular chaperone HtpG
MTHRKGTITVKTNDIFPIIKKWLYSEHDIFIRELISNATDAITKRANLSRTKNLEIPSGQIEVTVNKDQKTIVISDNGIGMTEDEVEKYIAQLAFSGAEEFVQKMQEAGNDAKDIIGRFGLGFYSTFMVADKVEVESLSMDEGAKPTKWICEGDTEYVFESSDKETVGTKITLHINKENEEFLYGYKVRSTLNNFCTFMPYPITVFDTEQIAEAKKKVEEHKDSDKEEDLKYKKDSLERAKGGDLINDTTPLWRKDPKDITDEEYIQFYNKLYPMDTPPLFWIHLKVDHPFTLEGILYFPKLNMNKPFNESNIKLYCKQVFVSDNVKSIVPEFLVLLKGVIDSTDIPLNVSRSALQGDPNIKKISNYIIKKVAESLKKLFKNDREKFEKIWEDIALFVKYGIISDGKFDELMRKMALFRDADNKLVTLEEYKNSIPEEYKEKVGDKVLYFDKQKGDWALRKQLHAEGIHSIETDDHIDPHFMQHAESKKQGDLELKFCSIDSEIANILSSENTNENDIKIKDLFQKILTGKSEDEKEEEAPKNPMEDNSIDVEIQKLKNSTSPAYFKVDEQMKRFSQMAKSMGQSSTFPVKKTLVVNPSNPLIKNALTIWEKGDNEKLVEKICHHVEDLAQISSEGLKDEDKEQFVKRTQDLIQDLTSFAL